MAFTFAPLTNNFSIEYIIQLVIDDTGRADKLEEIKRRIQRALMHHHLKDYYKKDHIDAIYVFQTPGQLEQVIDTTLIINFRNPSYIRKFQTVDVNGNPIAPTTEQGDLKETAPEKAFDGYGFDKLNVFYRSGTDIKIRSSTPIDQVFMGYYTFPAIEPIANINSWIANEYPTLIAATAKRRIFKDIGKDDEAKSAKEEEDEELATLQTNNITLEAH